MTTISVSCGDASQWQGEADVVFTHPYKNIPRCLWGKPAILNLYEGRENRQKLAEGWIGSPLTELGRWGRGHDNTVYVTHLPFRSISLDDLVEDGVLPGGGGPFPLELPRRLCAAYADLIHPGMTVWDGFCGRGTVGKVCQELGLGYIGLDIDPARVALTREFLGIA